ncbi:pectin lyase-like protein [Pleurotus eryngii]|uniref:Pectin lyase-like protein n=1 Tax=Pleurotus eryngii TaxID=5323 RepID=A0A9P6DDS9_PLEER|nr:pectin lyase-like protein [Pleurotus eryngii]
MWLRTPFAGKEAVCGEGESVYIGRRVLLRWDNRWEVLEMGVAEAVFRSLDECQHLLYTHLVAHSEAQFLRPPTRRSVRRPAGTHNPNIRRRAMRHASADTFDTMKYTLLLLAAAGNALALTEYSGPVPKLRHKPFGFAGQTTGGSTNSSALYVVSDAGELREAVALPYAKTIYVNGTIQGNQLPNGTLARCQDYIDMTGPPGSAVHGFNFKTYLLSLNATYVSLVEQAIVDNTPFEGRNATEYRTLLGHQNGYRPVVAATQKAQVGFKLDERYLVDRLGCECRAKWDQLVPFVHCFPAPETFPSSWNALYDAVGLVTASNVWVDNCELQDQLSGEYVEPDIIEPGWQVDRFDGWILSRYSLLGLFDCEDGADNVTFSHNIVRNHHKSLLLGGGTKEADRDLGKMRFTIFGNHFNGSASRNPLMRFGSFDIFSNVYETRNDNPPRFNDASQAGRRRRRGALDRAPLDAVYQYHLGVYNQSRVQVQDNVFLQHGAFPNDTSRIFTISEATLSDRPAKVCIRETPPHFPSTMNGVAIASLSEVMADTVHSFVDSGKAVEGAVVLTCDRFQGYELPKVFEDSEDVLRYVLSEAGQAGRRRRRGALDRAPLDAVFQYHLGVYNQSRVQVQVNVFLRHGAFPNDTSRIFTISEATLSDRPAKVCIRETPPHFPSTMNGVAIASLSEVVADTVHFFVDSGRAVDGAVLLTCDGFRGYELPKVFEDSGDVLGYVLSEAGQGHVPQRQYQIFARIEPAQGAPCCFYSILSDVHILKLCSAMSVRLSLATVGDGMPISGLLRAWLLHAGLGPKLSKYWLHCEDQLELQRNIEGLLKDQMNGLDPPPRLQWVDTRSDDRAMFSIPSHSALQSTGCRRVTIGSSIANELMNRRQGKYWSWDMIDTENNEKGTK